MPDTAADAVLVELAMEVPLLFVPCQYQVMPEGADPERVSVLSPHVLVETEKAAGWLGSGLTVTLTDLAALQQLVVLSLVRT